ncbi:MAG: hypothetical protein O2816_13415 [Planctomycetota bacterium]|nr:hypothetical protein [Planctomycetota bacterium]
MAFAKWFESKPVSLPQVVGRAPKQLAEGEGLVETDLQRGAILLVNEDGEHVRLSWEGEAGEDRGRALPVGTYHLTGYRVLATADDGTAWHLSATKPKLREIEVVAGETLELEIDQRVHLSLNQTAKRVNVAVMGDGHAGLSVYKAGRRIPLGYRLLDADGKSVAKGDLRYG